jgi:hypothetical protein
MTLGLINDTRVFALQESASPMQPATPNQHTSTLASINE